MPLIFFTIVALSLFAWSGCKKDKDPGLLFSTEQEFGPPPHHDGASCGSHRLCNGGTCMTTSDGWRGGYCTTKDCATAGCNGDDSQCMRFLDGASYCLDGCLDASDCRPGYACRAVNTSGARVCYRDMGDGPPAGMIGSQCDSDGDCREGTCDTSVRGGFCVGTCDQDCRDDTVCAPWGGKDRCVSACDEARDCRVGFVCDSGVCRPSDAIEPPFEFETTKDALGVHCDATKIDDNEFGTVWEIDFSVGAAAGYLVVPFVHYGALRPSKIRLPSGGSIDLVSDYIHHNIRAMEFEFFDLESEGIFGEVAMDWPLLVPYSPDRADLVESGTHTMELTTSLDTPCIYVLESTPEPAVLDINVIFAGLEGYDAAMAASDGDLRAVFDEVDRLFGQANLRLGEVNYYDAPAEIRERYAFVRDDADVRRATAFGVPRGATRRGHLSVDMFLVQRLQLGGGDVLGISAGLPGAPGMHGNPGNGLIFTGADLGSDNRYVAHIMAHEIGHYLGLRHTTEIVHNLDVGVELAELLGTTDPISDTPECQSPYFQPGNCPDLYNLMFPALVVGSSGELTPGQAAVLRANPLFTAE